ncbi:hypothetical protein TTHERM_000986289 (macronuclear) [Tetrahymena thermophila SB210]|uniref:Uncharacterized protein n=1 Tax=Tetrahymena thermophila (strain SB210) TaxID=312017 RepID=W7X7U5_TETTS|nr:hypothetical protein TTHERM_000986289 [Tetrahymena thermophila SB210]EWS75445.1 hypothetical protein TTHERM_000986289 [Tetrahymena thermophila SB210]|eukprot:XP_012652030.1 hypothetical protein TTHERM_000986289 [Tetrahymena thermophila SB210]
MKLYALISHCDTTNLNTKYVLNQLVSIDIASYQQNIIISYNNIVDQGLFNSQYLVFRSGSILIIFPLSDQHMKTLQTNIQISSYSFLQTEAIILFTDYNNQVYLTNPTFTGYNLINLSSNSRFQMVQSILTQSFISVIQTDQANQKQSLIIFGIQKQMDSQNQIYYTLGQQIQVIEYSGQNIQVTNLMNVIYLISNTGKFYLEKNKNLQNLILKQNKEIQIWKESKQVFQVNIENSLYNFIQDDCVIVNFNQNIYVFLNIQSDSQIEKQTYNYPIRTQINTVVFYQNSILVSAYYTIYSIQYYKKTEKQQTLQSFSHSNSQIKIDKQFKQTLVYSDDGIKVKILLIIYDTEYYIVGYVNNQQIAFRDQIGSQIINSWIILQNLFIQVDQQLYQLNLNTFQKKQIKFTNIIKILPENDNLFVIDWSDPSDCQQLQFTKFTSDQTQVCTLQFPNNPDYQFTCFINIQIESNLIVYDAGFYFILFQYNCQTRILQQYMVRTFRYYYQIVIQ